MKFAMTGAALMTAMLPATVRAEAAAPASQPQPAVASAAASLPAPATVAAATPVIRLPEFAEKHYLLPAGTALKFRNVALVTTKGDKIKVGQTVGFELAEDVVVDGRTVIAARTPASAELLHVDYNGGDGKGGKLAGQMLAIRLGDRDVPVSGKFSDAGGSSGVGATALGILIPFGGALVRGGNAEIAAGQLVDGKLLVDIDFTETTAQVVPVRVSLQAAPATAQVASAR